MNFISLSILFWTYKNTRFERGDRLLKSELLTVFEQENSKIQEFKKYKFKR